MQSWPIAFHPQLVEDMTYPWYRSSHLEELRFGGNVGFVNRRGEIFPRSNIVAISPVSWGYINRPRIVRGTYSLAGLVAAPAIALPLEGWVSIS